MPTITDHLAGLTQPTQSARSLGYRMPGEFEPVAAVWLTYPHNRDTWPDCFDKACAQYDEFIKQASRFTKVNIIGRDFNWKTNDSWVRDYGPIFVVRNEGTEARRHEGTEGQRHEGTEARRHEGTEGKASENESEISNLKSQISNPQSQISNLKSQIPSTRNSELETRNLSPLACHDFTFNGWGGKYDTDHYQPRIDDIIPRFIAKHLNIPIWRHDLILEGGSIDVNGRGSVLTTEQCLLNVNRNSKLTRARIEESLHEALGTRHIIWLPGGIEGDDTDGHIDDVARFIDPATIAMIRAPRGHPDHEMLERNWAALSTAKDQDGDAINLVALPVPEPRFYDYPPIGNDEGGHYQLPMSHANFLILNEGVLVPTFGQKSDDEAIAALEKAMPRHTIVGVRCDHLVVGFGAMHCLSMQQPRI